MRKKQESVVMDTTKGMQSTVEIATLDELLGYDHVTIECSLTIRHGGCHILRAMGCTVFLGQGKQYAGC